MIVSSIQSPLSASMFYVTANPTSSHASSFLSPPYTASSYNTIATMAYANNHNHQHPHQHQHQHHRQQSSDYVVSSYANTTTPQLDSHETLPHRPSMLVQLLASHIGKCTTNAVHAQTCFNKFKYRNSRNRDCVTANR